MEQRRREVEEEVARREAEISDCENALHQFVSAGESVRLAKLLDQNRKELVALLAEWEELSQVIESPS